MKTKHSLKGNHSDHVDVEAHLDVPVFKANMPKFLPAHLCQGDAQKNGSHAFDDATNLDMTSHESSTDTFEDEDGKEETIEFGIYGHVIPASIRVCSNDFDSTTTNYFVKKRHIYVRRRRRSLYCLSAVAAITLLASVTVGIFSAIKIIQSRKPAHLTLGSNGGFDVPRDPKDEGRPRDAQNPGVSNGALNPPTNEKLKNALHGFQREEWDPKKGEWKEVGNDSSIPQWGNGPTHPRNEGIIHSSIEIDLNEGA